MIRWRMDGWHSIWDSVNQGMSGCSKAERSQLATTTSSSNYIMTSVAKGDFVMTFVFCMFLSFFPLYLDQCGLWQGAREKKEMSFSGSRPAEMGWLFFSFDLWTKTRPFMLHFLCASHSLWPRGAICLDFALTTLTLTVCFWRRKERFWPNICLTNIMARPDDNGPSSRLGPLSTAASTSDHNSIYSSSVSDHVKNVDENLVAIYRCRPGASC